MENYKLQKHETVLFRGRAIILPGGKRDEDITERIDVYLTNLNFVFIVKERRLFKTVDAAKTFSVLDVKNVDGKIQIIRKKTLVEMYFKSGEMFVDFEKEKIAKEFCDAALTLISGDSKLVRSIKQTQESIVKGAESLGVDIATVAKEGALLVCNAVLNDEKGKAKKLARAVKDRILGDEQQPAQEVLEAPKKEDAKLLEAPKKTKK